jgi:signal transduction histidine kinase
MALARDAERERPVKTITARFVMLVATAAVLPLVLYGVVSISSLLSATRQSVRQGNLNVATRAAEQVQLYVTTTTKILEALAADLRHTALEPWQQERILKNYVLAFPEFREVTLFDETGAVVASSRVGPPRIVLPPERAFAGGDLYLSPFTLDDDLLPTLTAAIRLNRFDRSNGWLAAEFNLIEMWRMVDRIRVGERGFALIVAGDGRLVAHGDPDQKRRIARGDNLSEHPLVVALRGDGERLHESADVLAVAAPIPALGWTLIVEEPTAEAYSAARQLVRQLFVAISLAVIVTIAAGYFWGRSFIRPIFALMRATRALADGRLDERVRIEHRGDELEQLGSAFNRMADRLVELQEDVRKRERQAVFGRIAAGLVHDLSHPIQNIANSCKLILKMADDRDYRALFKQTTEREFGAIRRVLEGLRNLARPKPVERYPLDVNRSVADIVETMQPYAEVAGVTLTADLAPEGPVIEADLFAIGRVYRNLITNALQATAPGGLITVRTSVGNGRVRVEVQDTGCGIPVERQAQIFEDFATTKRSGLGLGLAICQKIVEQLDGTITVSSEVGRGSTFVLDFQESTARMPAAS